MPRPLQGPHERYAAPRPGKHCPACGERVYGVRSNVTGKTLWVTSFTGRLSCPASHLPPVNQQTL